MYRFVSCECRSQFDSIPLTSSTPFSTGPARSSVYAAVAAPMAAYCNDVIGALPDAAFTVQRRSSVPGERGERYERISANERALNFFGPVQTSEIVRITEIVVDWSTAALKIEAERGTRTSPPKSVRERLLALAGRAGRKGSASGAGAGASSSSGSKGRSAPKALETTLKQCLEDYAGQERLSQRNSWYCPACKEHVRALKTLNVWSLPKVLVVHLKRFCINDDGTVAAANRKLGGYALQQRSKLHHLVLFPLDGLDPSPCLAENAAGRSDPPVLYDCFAVINHMGSLIGGHYTALARSWSEAAPGKSGSWCVARKSPRSAARARPCLSGTHARLALTFPLRHCALRRYEYNDKRVTRVAPSSVVTANAYVLFYRRRDVP